jgi:protein-S-isoprenylcysteine O-methyltransferase Ste14
MDPLFGKIAVFVSLLLFVLIRWPHGNRYQSLQVSENRRGKLETALLTLAGVGTTLIPIVWITSGFPSAADYPLHPIPFAIGLVLMLFGLWLFYRSHADLGINWSATLQIRDGHQLVTSGIYSRLRHPMYASMFLLGVAQVLFLPNWIAGPAYLVSFGTLYVFRFKIEERMMLDRFGEEYKSYMQRTGRLIPRLRAR